MKRYRMSRRGSNRSFVRGAKRIKKINDVRPMRGGIRL